ncbi:hypothetical protein BDK51DRAFT_50867 [Blyttiomyces helicus]|uniref:Uncharacterized protein n=1 Tax=Blyttiomyces helicus TaxID=388810 RepID=A0A4P9WLF9_9FUNG|nr:hypothetical protein BDK51DRAFT_50867 [Blyttiomyces helicus]|eukprot:RKO92448.1 hypothetical protein BDK51DRAFT_50867 [Blyttiomyces helicus]
MPLLKCPLRRRRADLPLRTSPARLPSDVNLAPPCQGHYRPAAPVILGTLRARTNIAGAGRNNVEALSRHGLSGKPLPSHCDPCLRQRRRSRPLASGVLDSPTDPQTSCASSSRAIPSGVRGAFCKSSRAAVRARGTSLWRRGSAQSGTVSRILPRTKSQRSQTGLRRHDPFRGNSANMYSAVSRPRAVSCACQRCPIGHGPPWMTSTEVLIKGPIVDLLNADCVRFEVTRRSEPAEKGHSWALPPMPIFLEAGVKQGILHQSANDK